MQHRTDSSLERTAGAALAVLIVLQTTMLGALFSSTPPHPPLVVAPFALGPFLGAAIALPVAALVLGAARTREGRAASGVAALFALVSFGPQKWFDPAFAQIWPAVVLAQISIVALGWALYRRTRTVSGGDTGSGAYAGRAMPMREH